VVNTQHREVSVILAGYKNDKLSTVLRSGVCRRIAEGMTNRTKQKLNYSVLIVYREITVGRVLITEREFAPYPVIQNPQKNQLDHRQHIQRRS